MKLTLTLLLFAIGATGALADKPANKVEAAIKATKGAKDKEHPKPEKPDKDKDHDHDKPHDYGCPRPPRHP